MNVKDSIILNRFNVMRLRARNQHTKLLVEIEAQKQNAWELHAIQQDITNARIADALEDLVDIAKPKQK